MSLRFTIERIDELRHSAGIDDVELHEDINRLRVGDLVTLTFLSCTDPPISEMLPVRITRIAGNDFRGRLTRQPAHAGLQLLGKTTSIVFTRSQIHSIAVLSTARGVGRKKPH